MTAQKFTGKGYIKLVDQSVATNHFYKMTISKYPQDTVYLYGTNRDLSGLNQKCLESFTPIDFVPAEELYIQKIEESCSPYVYTDDMDLWVYFSLSDASYVLLPDNPDVTEMPTGLTSYELSKINPTHFPLGGGGTPALTPAVSIADSSASVTVSTTPATTYMQFQNKIWSQNDTDSFSFTGGEFTFLKDGVYQLEVIANTNKIGTGFIEGSLACFAEINGTVPKNGSLKIQINSGGTIGASFIGKLPFTAGDVLKIYFVDAGSGALTATTTAEHDSFILQVNKV